MRLKNIFPDYLIRYFFLLVLIILPPPLFSSESNIYKLSGRVTDTLGVPMEDLQLILFSTPGSFPDSDADTFNLTTGGEFSFTLLKDSSYILQIKGDQGYGRVVIPPGKPKGIQKERIDITYPVTEKIVILHTNDQHFTMNNHRELHRKITEIREKYDDVFLFNAGDIFVRHPLRWIVNGRLMGEDWYGERSMSMISSMNDMGYDLMTPGNHELSYRVPDTRLALESACFPLLAANIEITTDNLPPMDDYKIFNTSTMRQIAVLGLTTGISQGVRELGLSETVNEFLFLRDSAEIFMALTHLGLRRDRSLAEEFPEFDVIIGGHSHDLLREGEIVNSVLIAQAGGNPHIVLDSHPVFLGKIIISLENGVITGKQGKILEIKSGESAETEDDVAGKADGKTIFRNRFSILTE